MSDITAHNHSTDLVIKAEISLYYDLSIPEYLPAQAPLLVAVHGYGAHKGHMMREARLVAPDGFVVASLQGPHQHFRRTDSGLKTGFGWLTGYKPEEYIALHHRFILDVIGKLSAEGIVDRSAVYLYGFSQSCALNFRFAFTHPAALKGIVGVCGGIPGDLDTNPAYRSFEAPALYLYGDDDEFYTREQFAGFDARLRGRVPNYRSKHYRAGHEITDEMRADIREFLLPG